MSYTSATSAAAAAEEQDMAMAIAASLNASPPAYPARGAAASTAPPAGSSQAQLPSGAASARGATPMSAPLPGGGIVIRHVIESDNSCLFNAVSTLRCRSERFSLAAPPGGLSKAVHVFMTCRCMNEP